MLTSDTQAPLAQMAIDFLSVPGKCCPPLKSSLICCLLISGRPLHFAATSSDAERAFSRGRLTVSRLRHSLNDASVRANTLLGSWSAIPGLVSEPDILAKFGGKAAHSRASSEASALTIDLTNEEDDAATASTSATSAKAKQPAKAAKARSSKPAKPAVYRRKSNASSSDVMEIESEDDE